MVVKSGILIPSSHASEPHKGSSDTCPPPQVPPRMKKKRGPALPEKPPHLKMGSRPPSELQDLKREVLVAASKGVRERPVDKRQREPAKLLVQISMDSGSKGQNRAVFKDRLRPQQDMIKPLKDRLNVKPEDRRLVRGPMLDTRASQRGPRLLVPAPRGTDHPRPVVLIPVWRPQQQVVVRTGSLNSQEGSSGSDSETFPKSALKKQRLRSSGRKGGKNVTFNAFATVQVMEA